jgi:cysteine-rich repeat protein
MASSVTTASTTAGMVECYAGCRVGARCGDGVVQGTETCDDGNRTSHDGCSSTCRDEDGSIF